MTIDESWMREICTSSLTRGRDIARQARYAVFRHRRGNPETRSTETYPYRCTLSTLPADGTLALEARRGTKTNRGCKPGRAQASIKKKGAHEGCGSERVSLRGLPPLGGCGRRIRSGFRRTLGSPRRKRKARLRTARPGRKSFLPNHLLRSVGC